MKKKMKFPEMYDVKKAIERYPTEIDCPKCVKTGWDGESKCAKCDGYGVININKRQRMQLAFGDCVLDEATGTIIQYV